MKHEVFFTFVDYFAFFVLIWLIITIIRAYSTRKPKPPVEVQEDKQDWTWFG